MKPKYKGNKMGGGGRGKRVHLPEQFGLQSVALDFIRKAQVDVEAGNIIMRKLMRRMKAEQRVCLRAAT